MHKHGEIGRWVAEKQYANPMIMVWLLLGPPLIWLMIFYLAPLAALLSQSFFYFDEFSMTTTHEFTFDNFVTLFTTRSFVDIIIRTIATSIAVSIGCLFLGYPVAYFMARHATGATKAVLYVAVMVPMWASYIVKAYAWTILLSAQGPLVSGIESIGLNGLLQGMLSIPGVGGTTLSTSHFGRFVAFTYLWLPFMILPVQAAIERVPRNLMIASADLGASPAQTFFHVLLPLSIPGVAAGSIFTFCLTLGDYIIPSLVGPPGDFLGMAVYRFQGAIGNIPLAAAMTIVPIVVVGAWLWLAKKLGAFDAI